MVATATLVAALAAAAVVVVVVADGGGTTRQAGRTTPPRRPAPAAPAPGTTTPVPGLKRPLAGLLTRDGPPGPALASAVSGWVVNADWSDLQPTPDGPLARDNVIDRAIAEARRTAAPGTTAELKVRLFAGTHAPEWAKSLGGAPVPVTDPQSGRTGTIGRFWEAAFGRAYAQLQVRLGAAYDAVPEIREVTAARCTTFYSEPFIRDAQAKATISALLGAGFTAAADETCQREQIDAHDVWHQTRTSLAFNPYQHLEPAGTWFNDMAFTRQMAASCRQRLGNRCVLENNSVRWPVLGDGALYDVLRSFGPPFTFQTATIERVGDLAGAVRFCVDLGAGAVELPGGSAVPVADLAVLDRALRANADRVPG